MTPEEQRIAIAEACGYKSIRSIQPGHPYGNHPDPEIGRTSLPNFPESLDAMHEAEKAAIGSKLAGEYDLQLRRIFGAQSWTWHATAAQRAEAFLKTIGKWKD